MNKVAQAVGLSPDEFRRRNFLHQGESTAVGQVIREKVDLSGLMEHAFALSNYHAKIRDFSRDNPGRRIRKGIGFASFMHGAGFTGSGEVMLASIAGVEATSEGRVRVLAASTEMGQGTNTILSQLAADTLGLPYESVDVAQPDTATVPNSGPTVASRTVMIVGKLVESAALALKQTLLGSGLLAEGYDPAQFERAARLYLEKIGPLRCFCQYQPPPDILWNEQEYRGDAYGAYAWAVYVAEVSVDTLTFEIQVDDFVAVQEVGRVIHPLLAAGQIEGGVAQGVGFALYENVVWQEGRMLNRQMTNYIMPTSVDVPRIRVYFEETPYPHGPHGAKGLGELPIDGPAPAVVNAIEHATGIRIDRIPVTPEVLMEAMEKVLV